MGLGNMSRSKGGGKPSSTPPTEQLMEDKVPMYKGDLKIELNKGKRDQNPIIVTLFGPPGLGKTNFGFTFPHVACCDTEMKAKDEWIKFYEKEFKAFEWNENNEVVPYHWDDVDEHNSRLSEVEDWGDIASFIDYYMKNPNVQTIMIDSESDLRVMAENWTEGEVGHKLINVKVPAAKSVQYRLVYKKLLYILHNARKNKKNLIYLAKSKDTYDDKSNMIEKDGSYDGYRKQIFYSNYFLKMCVGVKNSKGEVLYKKRRFCEVLKCSNMEYGKYPPYLIECNYKGIIEELVRGSEWEGSLDDYIRDVVAPMMVVMGVDR